MSTILEFRKLTPMFFNPYKKNKKTKQKHLAEDKDCWSKLEYRQQLNPHLMRMVALNLRQSK